MLSVFTLIVLMLNLVYLATLHPASFRALACIKYLVKGKGISACHYMSSAAQQILGPQ